MIIVTGGAGFIGSNVVKWLNQQGIDDIWVVDDLTDGKKIFNLNQLRIADFIDKDEFLTRIVGKNSLPKIDAILHQGACSTTTFWDGRAMMATNYDYSKALLHYCLQQQIAFIYASSAAVYGDKTGFKVDPSCERPLNVYAYSKWLFDNYVRKHLPMARSQIVGLRYFNVYGPNEQHKGSMASVAYHFNNQLLANGQINLFEGSDGYQNGEQQRDFVFVDDVANVNLWFMNNPSLSGIYNVGTGQAESFNQVARAVINWHGHGKMDYIPFPDHLKGSYQSYTQADITSLRQAGYDQPFHTVQQGVAAYLRALQVE